MSATDKIPLTNSRRLRHPEKPMDIEDAIALAAYKVLRAQHAIDGRRHLLPNALVLPL